MSDYDGRRSRAVLKAGCDLDAVMFSVLELAGRSGVSESEVEVEVSRLLEEGLFSRAGEPFFHARYMVSPEGRAAHQKNESEPAADRPGIGDSLRAMAVRLLTRRRKLLLGALGGVVTLGIAVLAFNGGGRPPIGDGGATQLLDRDDAEVCHQVADYGQPLVVDWEPHQRAKIEAMMREGVAVVAYDCRSFRLLSGCSVAGSYGFVPISRKEEVIRLDDSGELRANLPAFGDQVARKLDVEFSRGSTLDVAMVLLGMKRTTVSHVSREALRGGAACDNATHFVRGAFMGAFALGLGTKGKASSVTDVFSGNGESSKFSSYRDGQPDTCAQLPDNADVPTATCDALVRLELVALDLPAEPTNNDPVGQPPICKEGLVFGDGKCSVASPGVAHVCVPGDVADCTAQCDLHDAPSCVNLGEMAERGEGVPKDPVRAAALFKLGCDGGDAHGCTDLGRSYGRGIGFTKDHERAVSLFELGCAGGDLRGCVDLGIEYRHGRGVPPDPVRALGLVKRGCAGGDARGCTVEGEIFQRGEVGVPKDEPRALALFRQACDGADLRGCTRLGDMYRDGSGVVADASHAVALFKQGCAGESVDGCVDLAGMYLQGTGVPQDPVRAAALYKQACDGGEARGCSRLGQLHSGAN